jgi:hypothetical protein
MKISRPREKLTRAVNHKLAVFNRHFRFLRPESAKKGREQTYTRGALSITRLPGSSTRNLSSFLGIVREARRHHPKVNESDSKSPLLVPGRIPLVIVLGRNDGRIVKGPWAVPHLPGISERALSVVSLKSSHKACLFSIDSVHALSVTSPNSLFSGIHESVLSNPTNCLYKSS